VLRVKVTVDPHPLLRLTAFATELPTPLGELPSPEDLRALLTLRVEARLTPSDDLRKAVRDLLRHGGHKPTGRGKPASEYLARSAMEEGAVRSINVAVDACNVVSLHSGFPISVVDLARVREPFRVGVAPKDDRYVFNASGQEIDLGGLLCLFDAEGPCANAVKDSQRAKTDGSTRRTLSLIWGCAGFEDRSRDAMAWYRELLEQAGAATHDVEIVWDGV
jgi:DNA/RNA-binding domain of Phe-tRNA-synthetase-like protein